MRRLRGSEPPSTRRVIAIKGYSTSFGRALHVLAALEQVADALRGYEIVLYSATRDTRRAAAAIERRTGIRMNVLPPASQNEVVQLFGRARVAVASSVSDGSPNAMIEAMAMGALPVQSDTVSTREWITDGQNGLLVPPEDPRRIGSAVRRALEDDALVDGAAAENAAALPRRVDARVVKPQVLATYERLLAGPRGHTHG
jgi:glycosyltransferase involved in cell wall biosynthesis